MRKLSCAIFERALRSGETERRTLDRKFTRQGRLRSNRPKNKLLQQPTGGLMPHDTTRLPDPPSQCPAKPTLFDAVHSRFSTRKLSLSRHCQKPVSPDPNCDLSNLNARSKTVQVKQGEPFRIRTVFYVGNRLESLLSSHPCSGQVAPPGEVGGCRHEDRPLRSSPAVLQFRSSEIRSSRGLCLVEPDFTRCDYDRFTGRPVIG